MGYEGSKAFIGGNPVKKIINSTREIREILYVDLNACNNYKTGKESLEKSFVLRYVFLETWTKWCL